MTHDEIVSFAKKHVVKLTTEEVKRDLRKLNAEFLKSAPIIRDQKAFNERTYNL